MSKAVVGGVIVVSLVILGAVALAQPNPGAPRGTQSSDSASGSNHLIAFSAPTADNRQQLTIIDPETRVVSVYHVEANGVITLKSVRNIHWDLQMLDYNGAGPLPRDVRAQVEQR